MDKIYLIVVILIAIFILAALLSYLKAEKRRRELKAWARSHGLSFDPDRDCKIEDRYPKFPFRKKGSNRYAFNIMKGAHGQRQVCGFDFHYETYSYDSKGRRHTEHHYFSALIVESGLPLKPLVIRGETFLDKVGEFLGFDDIDFESAEFSRRFCVKSPDRRWAFDVLHQASIEFLLNSPRFDLQFRDGCILAYRGTLFTPGDFDAAFKVVNGLLDLLPESVVRELKGVS